MNFSLTNLVMLRMPELSPTGVASKATLTIMDEHVIVERVLTRERSVADLANKSFDSCVRSE